MEPLEPLLPHVPAESLQIISNPVLNSPSVNGAGTLLAGMMNRKESAHVWGVFGHVPGSSNGLVEDVSPSKLILGLLDGKSQPLPAGAPRASPVWMDREKFTVIPENLLQISVTG